MNLKCQLSVWEPMKPNESQDEAVEGRSFSISCKGVGEYPAPFSESFAFDRILPASTRNGVTNMPGCAKLSVNMARVIIVPSRTSVNKKSGEALGR